jgi:peptidoglycan/LPS O-acetylase OafA/YrhL
VASLLVVLFHMAGIMGLPKYFAVTFGGIFNFGDAGVEFFFVLSGFIITWVHTPDLGTPAKLLPYLCKRAVRIYPTYWIAFAGTYLLMFCFDANSVPHDFPTIFESLALLPQDPLVVGGTGSPVVVTAWSLQYEILFYVLGSVVILSRLAGSALMLLFLGNFAACHLGVCAFPRSFAANNLMLLFAFGASIAWLCRSGIKLRRPLLVAAVGAAGFLATGVFEIAMGREMHGIDRRLVYGLWSGVIILGLVRAEAAGKLRIDPGWIPLLGDASYSLYLIHFPIIVVLCKFAMYTGTNGAVGAVVYSPIILAACVFSAVAFYTYIEQPILGWFRNRSAPPGVRPVRPAVSLGRSAHLRSAPNRPPENSQR